MTHAPIKLTYDHVRDFLKKYEGQVHDIDWLRKEMRIAKDSEAFEDVPNFIFHLKEQGVLADIGKRGQFKIVRKVLPIPVFSVQRERRPPFDLKFPRDRETDIELPMAGKYVVRQNDLILIAGMSNYGKTTMAMNFMAENLNLEPVLMGNEFTHLTGEKDTQGNSVYEPTPRFLNRMDAINWVSWVYDDGSDRFTLLPVWEDFAEHIVPNKINIVDWINLPGEAYMISDLLYRLKNRVANGVLIAVIQKNEGLTHGIGGSGTKFFTDLELLLDKHGELGESRVTIDKCKESTERLSGRSWAFGIHNHGVEIRNVREVMKCFKCFGKGHTAHGSCFDCKGKGWVDKPNMEF